MVTCVKCFLCGRFLRDGHYWEGRVPESSDPEWEVYGRCSLHGQVYTSTGSESVEFPDPQVAPVTQI